MLQDSVRRALALTARQHQGQTRRDGVTPYIVHPVEVAMLVSKLCDDEEVIAAALLHDVLEDTKGYDETDMRRDFGNRVTDMVLALTEDPSPDITWKERREKYLKSLRSSSDEVVLISLADRVANLTNPSVVRKRMWYYRGVEKIAEERKLTRRTQLLTDLGKLLDEAKLVG